MKFLSLCSGCGGLDLGLERSGMECAGQVEIMPFALKVLKRHWPTVPKHMDILALLRSDSLVRTYRTPTRRARVLEAKEAVSSSSVCESFVFLRRLGFSLKMFPDFFPLTEDGIWQSSFRRWPKAGMGGLTEFWTVDISESRNGAVESSLLDVLEECVHPKYYLSHKAVAGMIRRSERYGRGGVCLSTRSGERQDPTAETIIASPIQATDYGKVQHGQFGNEGNLVAQTVGTAKRGNALFIWQDTYIAETNADRERETTRIPRGVDRHRGIVLGNAVTVPVAEWIGGKIIEWEEQRIRTTIEDGEK